MSFSVLNLMRCHGNRIILEGYSGLFLQIEGTGTRWRRHLVVEYRLGLTSRNTVTADVDTIFTKDLVGRLLLK